MLGYNIGSERIYKLIHCNAKKSCERYEILLIILCNFCTIGIGNEYLDRFNMHGTFGVPAVHKEE